MDAKSKEDADFFEPIGRLGSGDEDVEAIAEMTQGPFGYHPIWDGMVEYIRKADVDRLRREAGLAAAEH